MVWCQGSVSAWERILRKVVWEWKTNNSESLMNAGWQPFVLLETAFCWIHLSCRPKPPLSWCISYFLRNCIFLKTVLKLTALPFCWATPDTFLIFGILLFLFIMGGVITLAGRTFRKGGTQGKCIIIQTSLCLQQLAALEKTHAILALFRAGNLATLSLPSLTWPDRYGILNLRAHHGGTSNNPSQIVSSTGKQVFKYMRLWWSFSYKTIHPPMSLPINIILRSILYILNESQ